MNKDLWDTVSHITSWIAGGMICGLLAILSLIVTPFLPASPLHLLLSPIPSATSLDIASCAPIEPVPTPSPKPKPNPKPKAQFSTLV